MTPTITGARPRADATVERTMDERWVVLSKALSPRLPRTNRPEQPPARMWLTTRSTAVTSTSNDRVRGEIIGGTTPRSASRHVHVAAVTLAFLSLPRQIWKRFFHGNTGQRLPRIRFG